MNTPSRWYFARAKKKYGPYTWQQLQKLAHTGQLLPADMLLQEGAKRWVEASSLPSLFPQAVLVEAPVTSPAPQKAVRSAERVKAAAIPTKNQSAQAPSPLLLGGVIGGVLVLIAACSVIGYFVFSNNVEPKQLVKNGDDKKTLAKTDSSGDRTQKTNDDVPPKTSVDKKSPPDEKKPITIPPGDWPRTIVETLNHHRKSAGLGAITHDPELSKGCRAHAEYLAEHVDASQAESASTHSEDPKKPRYSEAGARAAQNGLIAYSDPGQSLERWIGQVQARVVLLNTELHAIGLGVAKNAKGEWITVLEPARGSADPIVIYPVANQTDTPMSFAGGPEVPEQKAAAGYPITITFPQGKQVSGGSIDLLDEKGSAIPGWLWTPDKPVKQANQRNTVTFIPRGLLRSGVNYQVKASAQVDGKPWSKEWNFTTSDDSDSKGMWAKKAVERVNYFRKSAGLTPVTLDETLSKDCLLHARYLVMNEGHPKLEGLNAHDEDLSLPGASEAGRKSGKASNIAIGEFGPLDGVDAWMATLYHRVPILEPNLKTIGFACARGRRQGWVTLLNVAHGRPPGNRPHAVLYPAPDQTGVQLNFPNGGEEPNPIPEDKTGRAGYPITAFFPQDNPLRMSSGGLADDKGNVVPCWFSSPEVPANKDYAKYQGNTVCLIPKEPLRPNATYEVQMQGMIGSEKWEKQWKFTTGGAGLSVEDARQVVLERVNEYRARAGIGTVVLDEKLSKGCQSHAEYLAQNALGLLKNNKSVNDEDPLLPGFTPDGARAARQSDVFTNAPTPITQVDDLMATFARRVYLLDPALQSIGYGAVHDIGRGWRCVLDLNGGRGDGRVVTFPAPKTVDVPTVGYDRHKELPDKPGFPISVAFPGRATLRKVQAVMKLGTDKDIEVFVSSPEKPVSPNAPRNIVGVHPLAPLQAGQLYTVTVSAIVNGSEWRQTWQFKTKGN